MPPRLPPPLRIVSYTPAPAATGASPTTAPHPLLLRFPTPPNPPNSVSASKLTVFAPSAPAAPLTLALTTPTGRRFEGPATPLPPDTRYLIARVNRQTGAVRLEGAAAAVLLRPLTGAAAVALPPVPTPEVPDDVGTPAQRRRRRSELIATFGSKRSRKSAKTAAENELTAEKIGGEDAAVTAAALTAVAAAATRAAAEGGAAAAVGATPSAAAALVAGLAAGGDGTGADAPLLPPHDLAATSLDSAYPLAGLISPAEVDDVAAEADGLLERLDALQAGTHVSSSAHPLYVFDPWSAGLLASAAHAETRRHPRVMAALYVTYLGAFLRTSHKLSPRYQTGLGDVIGAPPAVVDRLLATFSEPDTRPGAASGTRLHTDATRDRVVSWALVAWLIAVDYAGEVEGVAQALGLTVPKALLYCIAAGCKVKAGKGELGERRYVARLAVPLVLAKLDRQRGGRGRK